MITISSRVFDILTVVSVGLYVVSGLIVVVAMISAGENKTLLKLSSPLILCILLGICWSTCGKYVPDEQVLIRDGVIQKVFAKKTLMWQSTWNSLSQGAHLVAYGEHQTLVTMTAHPITENPKVRSLRYLITVKSHPGPENVLKLEQIMGKQTNDNLLHTRVQSLLYEFNERNSKQLALLYNPLDDTQQNEFSKLLREFMAKPLEDSGAYVYTAAFDMGD